MAPGDSGRELPPKQRAAIRALLISRTVAEAAKQAGTSERTLYRWLTVPAFRAALAGAEAGVLDRVARQLLSLSEMATAVLHNRMKDGGAPATQLRAGTATIDLMLRLVELRNIEARLTRLEEVLNARD